MDEPDDAALLAAEHPAAFGRFYERHVGAVTSYVARRVERTGHTEGREIQKIIRRARARDALVTRRWRRPPKC